MKCGKWLVALVLGMGCLCETAYAGWFRRGRTYQTQTQTTYRQTSTSVQTNSSVSSAQGVANIMARIGRVGHFGGNRGYEGCGSGGSAAQAYNNCCYSNSGMRTVDVGYAQGSNGMWYACRRYQ